MDGMEQNSMDIYKKKYQKYKQKYTMLKQRGGQYNQVEENLSLQRKLNLDGFNNRNWKIVDEIIDENIILIFADEEVVHGRDAVVDVLMKQPLRWAPDTKIIQNIEFGSTDWTALNLFMGGTFIKEWVSPNGKIVQPNNKKYHISSCHLGRWKNGKLIELYVFTDSNSLMEQLGINNC